MHYTPEPHRRPYRTIDQWVGLQILIMWSMYSFLDWTPSSPCVGWCLRVRIFAVCPHGFVFVIVVVAVYLCHRCQSCHLWPRNAGTQVVGQWVLRVLLYGSLRKFAFMVVAYIVSWLTTLYIRWIMYNLYVAPVLSAWNDTHEKKRKRLKNTNFA